MAIIDTMKVSQSGSHSNEKHAQIWLNYFKQGCDLGFNLRGDGNGENSQDLPKAFESHSKQMLEVSEHLMKISSILKNYPDISKVSVDADTHYIGISGPSDLINRLVSENLANEEEFEEEFDEEEDEEFDEDFDDEELDDDDDENNSSDDDEE